MKYKLLAASILATLSTTAMSATYQLTEMGTMEGAKLGYVTDANENGQAVGLANGLYKLPIDVSYIDFTDNAIKNAYDQQVEYQELIDEEITFTLADIENNDAAATNPKAHAFMVSFLSGQAGDFNYQKLASAVATQYSSSTTTEQVLFDEQSVDYDGLTRSVYNILNAISDDGVSVGWGSAPFDKTTFTADGEDEQETFFVRDFMSRALVISADGVKVPLIPEFDEFGGTSTANDIVRTETGYIVVGNVSTGIPEDRQTNIDDNCDGEDEPVAVCIESLDRSLKNSSRTRNGLFDKRAYQWTLDENLNIISGNELGLGLTPKEDEKSAFLSNALAVNRNGTIVGASEVRYYKNEDTVPFTMPVYFDNEQVVEFINQEDDWFSGKALAVNNNDVITGYVSKRIEGKNTTKFFYHDITSNSTVFPTDFFSSSSSTANDINDNGYIVGQGETDIFNTSDRRREAFIYKIGEDKITNLNTLLPCYEADGETRFKYKVAEANAINNNDEIFGVATKTVEKTDSLGNVVLDSDGNIEYESVAVAVKLTPVAGSVEECPAKEIEEYERQSASFPWYALLLLPLVAVRRIFR
ncbi:DUF3466 family protein [Pseudoalteromonas mariniglutinosa]|uniref:DUF3466 family protein n=1 Tax=Pseudoalteromonas mariniglutinosa TaxID=206042 RepID=UPI00384D6454